MQSRCLPSIFFIVILMICGILILFACKQDDEITTTSTQSTTEAITERTTVEKTRFQLTKEELEQYGGAKGIISFIESFIAEQKTIEDIRDLYMMEPLMKLYFDYTDEELKEHFGTSDEEIEGTLKKIAGKITTWTINASSLGFTVARTGKGERIIPLIDKLCSELNEFNRDIFARTAALGMFERGGLEEARRHVLQYIRIKIDDLIFDIYPSNNEGQPDLTAYDSLKGKIRIDFDFRIGNDNDGYENPIERSGSHLLYEALPYADILTPVHMPESYVVTAEWMDVYFGGKHSTPEHIIKQYEPPFPFPFSVKEIYRSETREGYVDYVLVGQKGTLVGIHFYINLPAGSPDISQIVDKFNISEYIYHDIEPYKQPTGDALVSDAYKIDFKVTFPDNPVINRTSAMIIPMINEDKDGAYELNRKIKYDILTRNSMCIDIFVESITHPFGFFSDISYDWYDEFGVLAVIVGEKQYDNYIYLYTYFYDKETGREITYSEYINRFEIPWKYILNSLKQDEYTESPTGKSLRSLDVKLAYSDIDHIIVRGDGSFDIYSSIKDSLSTAYGEHFKVIVAPE